MKNKVIEFFQNLPQAEHEQFNAAFELYRNSPGKNLGIERSLNSSGFSKRALANLLYDLQKMHGVTDVEKIAIPVMEVVKDSDFVSKLDENILNASEDELRVFSKGYLDLGNRLDEFIEIALAEEQNTIAAILTEEQEKHDVAKSQLVGNGTGAPLVPINPDELKELKEENEDLNADKEDLEIENEDLKDENESLKSENESLKLLKKTDVESIRVEFPFLKEKDCPDEFKILIADKITAWNEYVDAQNAIAKHHAGDTLPEKDLAELAKIAVDAFAENQKIYEELNCYATFGRVLGIHPIFKKLQLSREVELMTADEMIAYKGATAKYFSVNKTALAKAEKAKDTVKITEINNRVAERSEKLFLVNKKLGVKNK
jgi:hypothetical protein